MWWKRSGARELRRLLLDEWDPIGVRGVPGAADEHDGYMSPIVSRLREEASAEDIARFLTEVEEERMGLGSSAAARSRNEAVAERLRSWYADAMTERG